MCIRDSVTYDHIITQYNAANFKAFEASYKSRMRDLPLTSISYKGHKVSYQERACPDKLAKLAALMESLVQ